MSEWYAPPPGIRTAEGGLASRWSRFLGQMIDGGIASGPLLIFGGVARFSGGIAPAFALLGGAWAVFYLLFGDIAQMLLGPIDWIFGDKHQRLGDKLVGTIVVLAD